MEHNGEARKPFLETNDAQPSGNARNRIQNGNALLKLGLKSNGGPFRRSSVPLWGREAT